MYCHIVSCRYLLILGLFDGVTILVRESLLLHDPNGLVDGVQLRHGSSVGVPVVVGPCEVLAVVASKVHVVESVMSGAVDELLEPVASNHVTVVNEDSPDLNADEKEHVEVLLHGADVDEDMVRKRLNVAVNRVESNGSPRGRNNPLVVRLVDVFVDTGVVLEAMNPVDTKIVKDHVQES
jgi:hypothetical protein